MSVILSHSPLSVKFMVVAQQQYVTARAQALSQYCCSEQTQTGINLTDQWGQSSRYTYIDAIDVFSLFIQFFRSWLLVCSLLYVISLELALAVQQVTQAHTSI